MCMAVLGLLGTVMSVAGSIMQGQQAAAMGKLQQQAYEQQAEAIQKSGAFEAQRARKEQERLQGEARAAVGASGMALAGSPTEVLMANAREGEMDIAGIMYNTQLKSQLALTQGKIADYQGQLEKTASYFNAGSNFISGISQMYDPNKSVSFGKSVFQ